MLKLLLITFSLVLSQISNPLKDKDKECKDIGGDLASCGGTEGCTYYPISDRVTWDRDQEIQVYTDLYGWQNGTIQSVDVDMLTVDVDPVVSSSGEVVNNHTLTIRDNRYSFVFRENSPLEFVGIRIEVFHRVEHRWFESRLTAINDDDWINPGMWADGGEFGNIVDLQPHEVRVSTIQDCWINPDFIEPTAEELVASRTGQEPEAVSCTKIFDESLCVTEKNFNCEWSDDWNVCALNNKTNNFIHCIKLSGDGKTVCEEDPIGCVYHAADEPGRDDPVCIDSAGSLSVIFLILVVLLLF